MTEEEWLSCTDPTPMVRYLKEQQTSERKLRLLACACCRQIWALLPDPRSRQAVQTAERYADGLASDRELAMARNNALGVADQGEHKAAWAPYNAANIKASGPIENVFLAAGEAPVRLAVQKASTDLRAVHDAAQTASALEQAALVREVIGNPFRPVVIEPRWLTWAGGTVVQLAEGVYEDRAFDRMPVLGDALEEAGCDDQAVLRHCRQSEGHVRGCWVVDLLLGKN
jgi:hypothetical protein